MYCPDNFEGVIRVLLVASTKVFSENFFSPGVIFPLMIFIPDDAGYFKVPSWKCSAFSSCELF